jgi:hypothetical protein
MKKFIETFIDLVTASIRKESGYRVPLVTFYLVMPIFIALPIFILRISEWTVLERLYTSIGLMILLGLIWIFISFVMTIIVSYWTHLWQIRKAKEAKEAIPKLLHKFLDGTLCSEEDRTRFITQILSMEEGNVKILTEPTPIILKKRITKEELGYYVYEVQSKLPPKKFSKEGVAVFFYETFGKNLDCGSSIDTFKSILKKHHEKHERYLKSVEKTARKLK